MQTIVVVGCVRYLIFYRAAEVEVLKPDADCRRFVVTMAIGCGLKCSKSVLLFFNLLFWVSY
jgi:hypothetical protein